MRIRKTVTIKGLVQGVGFRHYTAKTARRHGLTGWVTNLSDGSVQACFEGEESEVQAVVDWCRTGPEIADVDEVVEQAGEYTGEFGEFFIKQ